MRMIVRGVWRFFLSTLIYRTVLREYYGYEIMFLL
jgi:hypothetical protein